METNNLINLKPYEVHEFEWGSAIKKRNGDWERVYLKPNAQEINVMNLNVVLHDNGIEFCLWPKGE